MALRGISPGESTEQIIRQVEKMSRNMERSSRDNFRSYKVILSLANYLGSLHKSLAFAPNHHH